MLSVNLDGQTIAQLGELAEELHGVPLAVLRVKFAGFCNDHEAAERRARVPARPMRRSRAKAAQVARQRVLLAAAEFARRGLDLPTWSPPWLTA